MKRFLPDVNTLLALLDPMHVHHDAAHRWYASQSPFYLLALAAANDARFATFDTRIPAAAVAGGSAALETIPVS